MSGEAPQIAPGGGAPLRTPFLDPGDQGPILAPQGGTRGGNQVDLTQMFPGVESFEVGKAAEQRRQDQVSKDLMRMVRLTAEVDPEFEAEARRLGVDLGIGTRMAADNLEKARELWRSRIVEAEVAGSETLARRLLDPTFAAMAQDDIEEIGWALKTARFFQSGQLGHEQSMLYWKQSQQGGELSSEDRARLEQIELERLRLPQSSEGQGIWYGGSLMLGGMAETAKWSFINAAGAAGTALALGQMGPQVAVPEELVSVPAMAGTAATATVMHMSGMQIAGETYGRMRRLGISHELAAGKAEAAGMIGGTLEALSLRFMGGLVFGRALRQLAARKALGQRDVLKALAQAGGGYAAGVAGEVATEVAQELVAWGLTEQAIAESDRDQLNWSEYQDLDVGGVIAETLRGVAILAAFGPAIQFRNNLVLTQQATQLREALERHGSAVQGAKMTGRAPDIMAEMVDEMLEQTDGPKVVLFDLDTFIEKAQEAGITVPDLEKFAPSVAAALKNAEAQETGQVEIPMSELGVKFLASDFGRSMLEHARTDPNGMTAAEAVLFQENQEQLQQEAAKILGDEAKATEQFVAELGEVREGMRALLEAAGSAPREATVQAGLYANFVAVMADRMGMTPAEFNAQHGMTVSGEQDTQGQTLEQFELDPTDAREGRVLVDLDVAAVDAQLTDDQRIGEGGERSVVDSTGTSRYDRFSAWDRGEPTPGGRGGLPGREEGQPIIAPTMGFSDAGQLVFDNGRHRFAVLRDQGRNVQAAMTPEDAERARAAGLVAGELQQPISPAIPKKTKTRNPDPTDLQLPMLDLASRPEGSKAFDKNVSLFKAGTVTIKKGGKDIQLRGYDSVKAKGRGSKQRVESVIEQMVRNLQTLFDAVEPRVRERSRLWYDGANRLANAFADRYGITVSQAAGILAVLSPQADWRMNVSYAERILDAVTELGKKKATAAMDKWLREYVESRTTAKGRENAETVRKAIKGKTLDSIKNSLHQAYWIRAHDETTNDMAFRDLSPEGEFLGPVMKKDGSPAKLTWTSFEIMRSAIEIYRDGSVQAISESLGSAHKARNFYNNIFEPNSELPFVTSDTHQVAASLLMPLGASTIEVTHNLGGVGSAGSAGLGLSGTYWVYHEAVARAAESRGVLPREMQSISWEAVRALFSPEFKRNPDAVTEIRDTWKAHHAGKLTYDQAVERIFERAGGLDTPGWFEAAPGSGGNPAWGASSYDGGVPDARLRGGKSRRARRPARGAASRSGAARTRGAELEASDARGRYSPAAMRAILTENADPSTVMHEMLHHFAGEMLKIAATENAPPEILADVDTMMRFWGIEGETAADRLATWQSMSWEDQVPHHESLAYNFELWLFDGTSVTTGLRRLFQRIRAFMVNVYTSLVEAQRRLSGSYRNNFGRDLPGMTPELREMFERMVAGEQAAQQAAAIRELGPLFESEEDFIAAGHTPEQWKRYQELLDDSYQSMVDELNKRSLSAMQWQGRARARILRELKKKHADRRKAVREQVAEEVREEPIYRLLDFFKESKSGFDRAEVREMLGDIDEESWAAIVKKMGRSLRAKGGESVAFWFELMEGEFRDPRQMVSAVIAAPKIKEAIEQRTDAEMELRYGEPTTPEAVEEAIEAAIHNEARARFVAAELKFLDRATAPVRVTTAAARTAAERILRRRALSDMSAHKFGQLEARAGKAAREAMKSKPPRGEVEAQPADPAAATEHKRRELLFNQLAKLVLEVKDEVRKALAFFQKVNRGSNEKLRKTRDPELVQVARAILAQYGLAPRGKAADAIDYMELLGKSEEGRAILERFGPELAAAQAAGEKAGGDYREVTLDEFRALRELIESIWHLAQKSRQVEVDGRKMAIEQVVQELKDQALDARARDEVPGQKGGVKKQPFRDFFKSGIAALTKVEHYNRDLDGGKIGPFTRYLFLGVKEAVNRYREAATVHTKALVDSVKDLRDRGLLPDAPIPAIEEIGYTFGHKDTKAGGMVELLGALLHMGNESNRSKFLLAGRYRTPWADELTDGAVDYTRWNNLVQRLVDDGTLTREHFEWVQGVWDLLELIKPDLQAAHRELEGYRFKEVKAQPFPITFPDGETVTYRGGYVPASLDYEHARQAGLDSPHELTLEQLRGEFMKGLPKVGAGFTKERTAVTDRPLTMDINMIVGHIDKTMRYAHVEPAADQVRRILTNPEFAEAMDRADPLARREIYEKWLERAVTQSLYNEGFNPVIDKFAKHMRRMAGVASMAGNWVVAIQQFTGIANAANYVKVTHLKGGLMSLIRQRRQLTDEIARVSPFMSDRLSNQMFELSDDLRAISFGQTTMEKAQEKSVRWGYILQSVAQNLVDITVWKGAYDQAIAEAPGDESTAELETRAVREADQAVRLSQGSFSPEDVAAYEKGTPGWRAWTQFTSYFNTVLNQVVYAKEGEKLKAAILAFTIPTLVAEAIAMSFYDRWSDDDEDGYVDAKVFAELLIGAPIKTALAMVPVLGPNAANALTSLWSSRPTMGDRVVPSPMHSTIMRSVIGMRDALQSITSEGRLKARNVRDAFTLATFLPIPGAAALAPIARPAAYATGVATGETEPTGPVDFARGLATGYASQESRQ